MTPICLVAAFILFVLSGVCKYLLHRTRIDLFKGPFPIDHTRFGLMSKRARRLAVLSSFAAGAAIAQLAIALGAYLFSNWNP